MKHRGGVKSTHKSVFWMPRFFGWRYKKFYKTENVELAWRKFLVKKKFCVKNFGTFFCMKRWKNLQMQFLGKQNFGNLTSQSSPISGPCASFWIDALKLYLDSFSVKIIVLILLSPSPYPKGVIKGVLHNYLISHRSSEYSGQRTQFALRGVK